MLERPYQQRRDEAAVLADLRASSGSVARASTMSSATPRPRPRCGSRPKRWLVDLGLPGAKAWAGPGAQGAALLAVGAVVGAAVGVDVEGPVAALGVVVAEDVVGAGHHAGRAAGAQARASRPRRRARPMRFLGRHGRHPIQPPPAPRRAWPGDGPLRSYRPAVPELLEVETTAAWPRGPGPRVASVDVVDPRCLAGHPPRGLASALVRRFTAARRRGSCSCSTRRARLGCASA